MIDVDVRNVSKKFNKVVAVDNVSFQVKDGEFLPCLGQVVVERRRHYGLLLGSTALHQGKSTYAKWM